MKENNSNQESKNNKEDRLTNWNSVKYSLHCTEKAPYISEGEAWWCSCGENIGVEINGKHKRFARPFVVYRKINKDSFLGIPLTTQPHDNNAWYIRFKFHGKTSYAILCQIRVVSTKRLYNRMGEIDEKDKKRIEQGFARQYVTKNCLPS